MRRHIEDQCKAAITARDANLPEETVAITWLQDKAVSLLGSYPQTAVYLLAHADDGVIWGRLSDDGQTLLTSHDVASHISPSLRMVTLIQARLFCEEAEWMLWKDGDNRLHSRLLEETAPRPDYDACYEEPQMVWGTRGRPLDKGFTLLEEGTQGLRHAIPVPLGAHAARRPGEPLKIVLRVRHYLAREPFARVVVSRLVGLN